MIVNVATVRFPLVSWAAQLTEGKAVLEFAVIQTDKGEAIDILRSRQNTATVVFFGDDVTDEKAFRRLSGDDVGVKVGPGETLAHMRIEQTPPYMIMDAIRRNLRPEEFNPLRINPLRDLLDRMIDFDRLRAMKEPIVQVCATNVETARRRVFSNEELSVDAVLASATLPDLFPAVEIDGEHYWDGGLAGNPAMAGLIKVLPKCDFMIVRIDPVIRKEMRGLLATSMIALPNFRSTRRSGWSCPP